MNVGGCDEEDKNDDEEEEDPLDAYMKSLGEASDLKKHVDEQTNEQCNNISKNSKQPTRRLDLENEDDEEDYAHGFEVSHCSDDDDDAGRSRVCVDENEDDEGHHHGALEDEDVTIPSRRVQAAREALDNTFRKAGSSKNSSEWTSSKSMLPQHQQAAVTATVHNNIGRPTTENGGNNNNKCFWKGTDTERGRQWRREHQVVLSSLYHNKDSGSQSTASSWIDPVESLDDILSHCFYQQQQQQPASPLIFSTALTRPFQKLTLVQAQTLPVVLSGRDCVVTAATGQGKTLAYLWPVVVHCHRARQWTGDNNHNTNNSNNSNNDAVAVILVPTRELARQVHAQAVPWLEALKLNSLAVIGGQGRWKLLQELQQAVHHVIVATPGRLLDVVSNNKKRGISLDATTMVVLDEADQLLHMGFEPQVRQILQHIAPQQRQTLLLSATLGRRVERAAREWLSPDAWKIAVGRTGAASAHVQQFVHVLPHAKAKEQFVVELLPSLVAVGRTLVFVATKQGCERLADVVRRAHPDLALVTLHGDKHQVDRNAAVRALVKGTASVLIASDVAARGLDLPHVQTVVSLDPPKSLDAHVHRVGRAGRLSSKSNEQQQQQHGTAHTLLTPRDQSFAAVLRNAFQREGRDISHELEALASSSSAHHGQARTKGNRAGLGFSNTLPEDDDRGASEMGLPQDQPSPSYYGPNGGLAPPAKRGRWS